MGRLIICCIGGFSLAGCAAGLPGPSVKLVGPARSCMAAPEVAPVIKPGDDLVIDDAKLRRIIGTEVDGKLACQSYIRRLRKGA